VYDLRKLLPTDLRDIRVPSVNNGVLGLDVLALLNSTTGEHLTSLGGVPIDHPGFVLRVGRERLRDFPWASVAVSTGKKFSYYEEDEDGVVAFFEDGTSARRSISLEESRVHYSTIVCGRCSWIQ
jgi:hypothetical protein